MLYSTCIRRKSKFSTLSTLKMSTFYVSGSTPSAPVTHVKLFISYALPHCTTAMVKDVFDTVFDNEVTQIEELERKDRDTGKPFKLFWITLNPARHSRVWRFVDEIEQFKSARIIYETKRGTDYYWQVRLNVEKEKPTVKTTPRILPREVTTSETATAKERAEAIAFTKTPEFTKLVESVVFEGVIEPKLEPGEIKEKQKLKPKTKLNSAEKRKAEREMLQGVKERCEAMAANDASMEAKAAKAKAHMERAAAAGMTVEKYMWLLEDEKKERAALQEESSYGKRLRLEAEGVTVEKYVRFLEEDERLEMQEEALADWEQREHDAFIFNDETALAAM